MKRSVHEFAGMVSGLTIQSHDISEGAGRIHQLVAALRTMPLTWNSY